jgi:hypothetical protein
MTMRGACANALVLNTAATAAITINPNLIVASCCAR